MLGWHNYFETCPLLWGEKIGCGGSINCRGKNATDDKNNMVCKRLIPKEGRKEKKEKEKDEPGWTVRQIPRPLKWKGETVT